MPDVSVVVPVFNSEDTLHDFVDTLTSVLTQCTGSHEIILVDDGSADGSWTEMEKLASEYTAVRGIRLAQNFGEHNAVLCGIRESRHTVVVTLDDDLQQPPSEIPLLLDALDADVDLVYGVSDSYQHRRMRRTATAVAKNCLEYLFKVPRATVVTSFRAFRSTLSDAAVGSPGPLFSLDTLFAAATNRVESVPVRHERRRVGASQYGLRKLLAHSMNMLAGATTSPLLFASVIGAAQVAAGFIGTVALVVAAAFGSDIPFAIGAVAAVGSFVSGVILVALGVLGEYAARILLELSGRPPYVVEATTGDGDRRRR